MKYINLPNGATTSVDDEDYVYLNQWKWYKHRSGMVVRNVPLSVYVDRSHRQSVVFMHRVIMDTPSDMDTDHIDGNRANNQRKNLRICTHADNMKNRKLNTNSTSGYKGVHQDPRSDRWIARIQVDGNRVYLGKFSTPEQAAMEYDKHATDLFGQFARLNFPEGR